MKNNLKLRLVAVLLCLVMLFSTACTAQTTPAATTVPPTTVPATTVPTTTAPSSLPENGTEKIVQETVTLYITNEVSQPFPVAYYESTPEIFLIDMSTAYDEFFASMLNNKGVFTYEETETTLTIHRDNGTFCILDFVEDTITFNNYDLFCASRTNNLADMLSIPYVDEEGNSIYLSVTDSSYIAGLSICVDLADRDIPMDIYEGNKPIRAINFDTQIPISRNYLTTIIGNCLTQKENIIVNINDTLLTNDDTLIEEEDYIVQ